MMRWFRRNFCRYRRDEDGTIIVEFVIVAPLFVVLIAMGFEFFDAYKSYSRASKASYTIADFVSRQDDFDNADLAKMHAFLDGLLPWLNGEKSLRVTWFRYDKDEGYSVDKSLNYGDNRKKLTTATIPPDIHSILPDIAHGDMVILTETKVPHRPLIDMFKMSDIVWDNAIVVRPRYHYVIPPVS